MKHFYALISLFLTTLMSFSQGYQFGLVYNSGNNFSVIAVPDFNATNTDISDIGFALMLPAGNADVTNVSAFNGRAWTVTQVTATQLTSFGLDDGTRDAFALNLPPGQTILSHTSGQQIVIVSFEISNMPTTGQLQLLANTDPIAIGLGGAINSFYNSNIDNTTTQDYFSGFVSGMQGISFSTLGMNEVNLYDNLFKIYPNPVINHLTIESPYVGNFDLYVINQLGQEVMKQNQNDPLTSLDVSNLSKGLYFLNISSENGSYQTIKFIKN
ncbi:MAG: T9SS type A sorting domain-containing protein [Gelidibacter sp.]|nr:T9SS type A sorting domain-containing protein [Gelidibacter sp.]